jgi:PKD repeat protein
MKWRSGQYLVNHTTGLVPAFSKICTVFGFLLIVLAFIAIPCGAADAAPEAATGDAAENTTSSPEGDAAEASADEVEDSSAVPDEKHSGTTTLEEKPPADNTGQDAGASGTGSPQELIADPVPGTLTADTGNDTLTDNDESGEAEMRRETAGAGPPAGQEITTGNWKITTIASPVSDGYISLALTGNNEPCVAYYKKTGPELFYAQRDRQGTWNIESVGYQTQGKFPSLALNAAGIPSISFYDVDAQAVKYAKRTGPGTWSIVTVEDHVALSDSGIIIPTGPTTLRLDNAGKAHITYYDAQNRKMRYAVEKESNTWNIIQVDATGTGHFPSLDLYGSDTIGISYLNSEANPPKLKYVEDRSSGTRWGTNDYDTYVTGPTSLALTHDGKYADIAYKGASAARPYTQNLKFIRIDGSLKQAVEKDTVDDLDETRQNATIHSLSLRLDAGDNPHIGYSYEKSPEGSSGSPTRTLRYAEQSSSGGWTKETIAENTAGAYGHLSLALDSSERPFICYYDPAVGGVRLAERVPLGAGFTASTRSGTAPLTVSFVDQSAGNPTGRAWYFGDEPYTGTWTNVQNDPPWHDQGGHTAVSLPDGSIVVMEQKENGKVWRSTDKGKTWSVQSENAGWTSLGDGSVVSLPDGSIIAITTNVDYATNKISNTALRSADQGKTWKLQTSSPGWNGRTGSSVVALSDNSIILIGGIGVSQNYQDLWRSTDKGRTWTKQAGSIGFIPQGSVPAVVLNDDSIIVLGEYREIEGERYIDAVWRSADKGQTWTKQTEHAAGWGGRSDASTAVMPDGSILVMGGREGSTITYNDMWRSADQGRTWAKVVDHAGWDQRYGQATVVLPDGSIVVLSGHHNQFTSLGVWRMETAGSYEKDPTHTFTKPGIYNVTLQIYNDKGISREKMEITVTRNQTWILNTTPPTPPGTFPLYSGSGIEISDEDLESVIQSFDPVMDTSELTVGEGTGFRSAFTGNHDVEVSVYKGSGAIITHDNRIWAKTGQYAGVPPLPTPIEAIKVGSHWINSTFVFILAKGTEPDFSQPHVSYYNKIENESHILWQDATVSYERRPLNGYPVIGDIISTEIASDPIINGNWKVVSAYSNWRDWTRTVNSVNSIPFSSTGFERFKQTGVVPVNLNYQENASSITIYADSVSLAWYSPPGAVIRDVYLQPVYVVSGHIVIDGKTDSYFPVYIPATDRILVNIPPLKAEAIQESVPEAQRTTDLSVSSDEMGSSEEKSVMRESGQKPDTTYQMYIAAPIDYSGLNSPITQSENNVKGFRDNITGRSTEWSTISTDFRKDALPKKWKSKDKNEGEDDKYADKADLAYFDGHGSYGKLVFSHGGFPIETVSDLGHSDMLLGDTNVNWVVFDACKMMNKSHPDALLGDWKWEDWKPSFKGLHMMLGFDTTSNAVENRGYILANRLAGVTQGSKTGNVSIRQAWKDAIALTDGVGNGGGVLWVKPCGDEKLAGFSSESLCTPNDPNDFEYENWRVT